MTRTQWLFPTRTTRWFAPLLLEVEGAFAQTGADTPGWSDPHADREVAEEEYSHVSQPGKYRIINARVEAWVRALADHDIVCGDRTGSAQHWLDSGAWTARDFRLRRFRPAASGGLELLSWCEHSKEPST